jgi:hypothetical protein
MSLKVHVDPKHWHKAMK